jgi:multimeric flavodoxin WrbA
MSGDPGGTAKPSSPSAAASFASFVSFAAPRPPTPARAPAPGPAPATAPAPAPAALTGGPAPEPRVAVVYHSGNEHTTVLAHAVLAGAADGGAAVAEVRLGAAGEVDEAGWRALDAADAVVFGSPTYMGTASAAFHTFAQATSGRWAARAWRDKVAAGFTVAGAMSGDKLHTLTYFSLLASQHGMHWVNLDLAPGWTSSTGSEHDLNRLGITLGAGAQANTDQGPEAVTASDAATARHLGRRVAETAAVFALANAARLTASGPAPGVAA